MYSIELVEKINRRERVIPITMSSDETKEFVEKISLEPSFYFVSSVAVVSTLFKNSIRPTYLYNEKDIKKLKQDLEGIVNKLIEENTNTSQTEYDKVIKIYDYLKVNVGYDYDTLNKKTTSYALKNWESHKIVGPLINKKAVCQGFATALKYILEKMGIECHIVSGKGNNQPHAWNIVKINGYYHHVDVTWDNQYGKNEEISKYIYFGLTDDEMARDHTWDRRKYPNTTETPYNYYRLNNSLLETSAQLENFLVDNIKNYEENIEFKIKKDSQLNKEFASKIDIIMDKVKRRCGKQGVLDVHYSYFPEHLIYNFKITYK